MPCGIPYIYGTLGSPQKNLIPDSSLEANQVNLIIDTAERIDKDKKVVHTASGQEIGYDKLIIATGSVPALLPIPGIDKENVFIIKKELDYLQKLLEAVNQAKDVVIIGGGFIGAEFADEIKKGREINVTIVEQLPHCLQLAFDDEFCVEAEITLTNRGVKIVTGKSVSAITGVSKVEAVQLTDGTSLKADVVIASIGVKPVTDIAKASDIKVHHGTGGIAIDRYMRVTGCNDIFACGDCAMKVSYFNGKPVKTWLASVDTAEAVCRRQSLRDPLCRLHRGSLFHPDRRPGYRRRRPHRKTG